MGLLELLEATHGALDETGFDPVWRRVGPFRHKQAGGVSVSECLGCHEQAHIVEILRFEWRETPLEPFGVAIASGSRCHEHEKEGENGKKGGEKLGHADSYLLNREGAAVKE